MNLYAYVDNAPIAAFDIFGLSGELTLATDSNGTTLAVPIGSHSWLQFKRDVDGTTRSFGTWGDKSGGSHREGVNYDTEMNKPSLYKATETRTTHLSDEQEQALYDYIKAEFQKGGGAWSTSKNCSVFAAAGWNKVTGEKIDPSNGRGDPTPKKLGEAIRKANGGTPYGKK